MQSAVRFNAWGVSRRLFSSSDYPEHTVLVMPALSPTMESGGLESWSKEVGDEVREGDKLALIETDKATLDLDAVEDGFLAKILVEGGSKDVPVNAPIAVIVENKEDVAAFANFKAEGAPKEEKKEEKKVAEKKVEEKKPEEKKPEEKKPEKKQEGGRVFASPAARKEAESRGLALGEIDGSGPNSRVVLADVVGAQPRKQQAGQQQQQQQQQQGGGGGGGGYSEVAVSQIRKVTAQRLTEAKRNIPHYYLSVDTQVDELLRVRALLNADAGERGVKLSVNDFVVRAVAKALEEVPALNSHWHETSIRQYSEVHLGVAVNTDHGLFVPVVRNANFKGLGAINADVKQLAAKAKDRKLALAEMEGGTFTISNLGAFGVRSFSAVINPPQAGILAIGSAQATVVPAAPGSEHPYETRQVMNVTLSADHRVADGAVGAQFLKAVKKYIEDPLKLLL